MNPGCKFFMITNVLTPEEKKEILNLHNELRYKHATMSESYGELPFPENYKEFTWSDELAEIAQTWTNQCMGRDQHDKCRRTDKIEHVAQNIAEGEGSIRDLVNQWYGDLRVLKSSDYRKLEEWDRWEVETQAYRYKTFVWSEVRELGCGVVKINYNYTNHNSTTLICNYGPAEEMIYYPPLDF